MASTAFLVVDIIGSKELASQPGGHVAIHNLCQGMREFLDTELQQLNQDDALEITLLDPQGDDIEYRLRAASPQNVADASLAAVIAAFSSGPSGKRFRYVVYSSADVNYQPRIKVFADISKTEEGKKYHIAVERGLVSALANQEIITWLESATRLTISLDLIGEPWTGVYVDLYCRVSGNRDTDKQVSIGKGLPLKVYPPGGPVPVDAAHYIERDADDETLEALRVMPFTMLVRGPVQCGKSSLLTRLQDKARELDIQTTWFDPSPYLAASPRKGNQQATINARAARALCKQLQDEWNLDAPPKRSTIESIASWLINALAPTASSHHLLIIDDLASFGIAGASWEEFIREISNRRARGVQISVAVGLTHNFGLDFELRRTRFGSRVYWSPKIELDWFDGRQVGELEKRVLGHAPTSDESYALFGGQPYLTHAAASDGEFRDAVRRWIDEPSPTSARLVRAAQTYRRHLSALKLAILGPTLEADVETRNLLQTLEDACSGQAQSRPTYKLFLEAAKLLDETEKPSLMIYRLIAEDLLELTRR